MIKHKSKQVYKHITLKCKNVEFDDIAGKLIYFEQEFETFRNATRQ